MFCSGCSSYLIGFMIVFVGIILLGRYTDFKIVYGCFDCKIGK